MARIHKLGSEQPAKFGFKKARTGSRPSSKDQAQLNLFSAAASGRIVTLPTRLRPFEEALLLDERGSPAAAEAYERAIAEGDSVADAYCNLGIIRYHSGGIDEALHCFTQAIASQPRHFETHYNLANLFFDRGELEASSVQYGIAREIDDTYANLYFNLGLVNALLERYEPAYRALNTYRALAPDDEGRAADDLLESLRRTLIAAG